MNSWEIIAPHLASEADGAVPDVLVVVDHASAHVPEGVDLGIPAAALGTHIAVDLGAIDLARALGFEVFAATCSRLVIDCNRAPDAPGLIPDEGDGLPIPGNAGADQPRLRGERMAAIWTPYHEALAARLAIAPPALIVSLHSFTPRLAARPQEGRPWPIGILYNHDDRASKIMLAMLRGQGVDVGDQQPYSGKDLNYTMNRHAEANGIAYLGIEMRQDEIADPGGVARWAAMLRPLIVDMVQNFQPIINSISSDLPIQSQVFP